MWIKIRSHDGPNISLPVPLTLAGSRFLWKMIANSDNPGADAAAVFGPEMIKELRSFVRRNGHFVLVDVESSDGEIVKIKV